MNRLIVTLCVSLVLAAWGQALAAPAAQAPPSAVSVAAQPRQFDLNLATAEELMTISGIGPVLANAIIAYRQKNGVFRKVDDLLGVAGVGPKNLERFRPYLAVPQTK
jgi:competence protein ComEA